MSTPLGMRIDIHTPELKAMAAQTVNACRDGYGSSKEDPPALPLPEIPCIRTKAYAGCLFYDEFYV